MVARESDKGGSKGWFHWRVYTHWKRFNFGLIIDIIFRQNIGIMIVFLFWEICVSIGKE